MWKYDCVVSVLYLGESVPPQYPPCQVEPGAETKIYSKSDMQAMLYSVSLLSNSSFEYSFPNLYEAAKFNLYPTED